MRADLAGSGGKAVDDHAVSANLSLNLRDDGRLLYRRFAAAGRVQIPDFLSMASADALRRALLAREDWRHVISGATNVFEIARADLDAMPAATRATLEQALHAEATHSFRFRYDLIRVPEPLPLLDHASQQEEDALLAFARLMNAPATLDVLGTVAPGMDVTFADAQATRYTCGDFLTCHDDAVTGKGRRMAYVLGLTPDWSPEWGGLLLFHGPDGSIVETFAPRFNALSLFTVPQPHSVSFVAPYAGTARLSVTGWLRA